MLQEPFEEGPAPPARNGGGRLVIAGVVGACLLGGGLGYWARPGDRDRDVPGLQAAQVEAPEPPGRRLQIVIDDMPAAPIGAPLEVLPGGAADVGTPRSVAPPPPVNPEPVVPRRPPAGLMKVVAHAPPAVAEFRADPKPASVREPAPKPVEARPGLEKAVAAAPARARPKAEKVIARAEPAKAKPPKATLAAVEKPKRAKAKTVQLAKADPPKPTPARAEPRKPSLLKLVVSVKPAPAKPKREVKRVAAKTPPKITKVAAPAKARKAPPAVVKASAPKPKPVKPLVKPPFKPLPRGEGPLRMVRNTCISSDPGEALVCADPRLSIRERQMQRAYRDAQAAGVPAAQLERQQQRWRAARAAAAREAPWAVEEVYEARIAELNDQSRDPDAN